MSVAIIYILTQEENSVPPFSKSRKSLVSLPSAVTFSRCAGHRKQQWDTSEEAVKEKDLNTPLYPSMPPLLSMVG